MLLNDLNLYQKGENFIWTDEYISKNMLSAHLDFNSDAASRNIKTIKKTLEWIISRMPKGGRVLDLGCGPGLYASLLAKEGYSVTGIDISERSIAWAKGKAAEEGLNIDYICRDYISGDIGEGYDAVICIYCDFGALIPDEQVILLNKIYNALREEGIFIFDVFGTGICNNKSEKRDWHYSAGGDFWCSSPYFILEEVKHFAEEKLWGTRTIILEEEKNPREYITWDQYYSEEDIKKLLYQNRFNLSYINNGLVAENDFASNDVMFIEAKREEILFE